MSWPFSADSPTLDEDTWPVSKYQRWVIIALLLGVLFTGLALAETFELFIVPSSMSLVIAIVLEPLPAFMAISTFMLARQFYSDLPALAFALMMCLPFVSILILLYINQKATHFLKSHGIHVGLFGASLSG